VLGLRTRDVLVVALPLSRSHLRSLSSDGFWLELYFEDGIPLLTVGAHALGGFIAEVFADVAVEALPH